VGDRTRTILTAFNAGELSPLLDGRVDQDKYFTGCKKLLNFIPSVQGPARRRGGTRYAGLVKDSTKRTWFADFVFNVSQAYVLEFGPSYIRFWTNRGQLLNVGVPYEIATPYTESDLITTEGTFALRTLQSGDVMWIAHAEGKHPPYRLSRLGATNWTLVQDDLLGGPFRELNTNAAVTAYASAVTGSVTVTASSAIFLAGHVGSLFRLESMNPSLVKPYQASITIVIGEQYRNGGNVYEALNGYTYSATDKEQRYVPVHTEGDADDGKVKWRYLHSGYGWGKITAIGGGGTTCTMTVLSRLPDEVISAPNTTKRWAFSDYSTVYGWPVYVAFFKERLCYVRSKVVDMSVVGDFNNFDRRDAGEVTKETAIRLTVSSDKLDNIRWMMQSRSLLLGSASAELSLQEQTSQSSFAADNAQNVPQTEYGAMLLRPLRVGEDILFAERAGHRIRAMKFSFEIDRYKADDLTVLSEHLFDGSEEEGQPEQDQREIIDWAYQKQRDSIVWCALSDGSLAALVINRERGVLAWSSHVLGGDGFVEAVQAIPSPDRRTDDVWFIVRRTVGGVTQRAVEFMLDYRLVKKGAAEAVHVDCSSTFRGAGPNPTLTVLTGLSRLEGKEVSICTDGANHPRKVVASAQVTLDTPSSVIHVGYGYPSRLKTMRMEVQGSGGTSQTARKGIASVALRIQSTIGGRVGGTFDKMDDIKTLDPAAPVGTPPKLFSGDYRIDFPEGLNPEGYICYEQPDPLPATIVALVSRVTIGD
jgi:hypothetical protein